ncbi:VWA domain-containing protein [Paenibacillus sp. CC-CFT747]|nr:VWA domain-containing protein [Paenibacillus sp. CC-CFT747]
MHFQWLNGLWFGLTLPAIVLLYLLKRQYIDTEIPSHLLWNRVLRNLEANRPWQKLRNQLLLILQLAAATLLVLALLQPFSWSPKGESGHTVYVLDRSASMEAATGSGEGTNSTLEEAKRRIAERIQAKSPGSLVTLLLMGTEPEVPVAREASADRVLEALKAVTPSYGKTAYKETMSLAAALTQDDPDGEIRVYTDGRWTDPAAGLTYSVPVHREDVGNPDAGNVSVMQFGVKAPDSSSGTMSAVAVLRNWGGTGREVEVTLAAGPKPVLHAKWRSRPASREAYIGTGFPFPIITGFKRSIRRIRIPRITVPMRFRKGTVPVRRCFCRKGICFWRRRSVWRISRLPRWPSSRAPLPLQPRANPI